MVFKFYGHSCFSLEVSGKTLLFDPFIRGNELAKEIDIRLVQADYILVSHGHEDHTGDLVFLAQQTKALVIASWEICTWLQKQGITNCHPMNIGGKKVFDFGKVTMTFAAHSSSLGDGTYAGIAAGFMMEAEGKTIYYSGDTGIHSDMKLLGERYAIDCALLPIGGNFTMDAEDAALAANFLKCNKVIGLHYDTFGYIVVNQEEAMKLFEERNVELNLVKIGGTTVI
jgi:L-ascorbate metabolism protein UlaG (beta-lactamase superfamily)